MPTIRLNERKHWRPLLLFHLWLEDLAIRTHKIVINVLEKEQIALAVAHVKKYFTAWACVCIEVWKLPILGAVDHCTDLARGVHINGQGQTHHAELATLNYRTSTTDCRT